MPLYKTIDESDDIRAYIWKIDETFDELNSDIELTGPCRKRMEGYKSEQRRLALLSVRHLLGEAGYSDRDLTYRDNGKPELSDGKQVSITHSHEFAGIITGDRKVGIDIEKRRDKILRIASRFTPLHEYRTLANDEAVIRKLTIVWCAKEAIYKVHGEAGLSFLHHIDVKDFRFGDGATTATVFYRGKATSYKVKFIEFEGFSCAYVF